MQGQFALAEAISRMKKDIYFFIQAMPNCFQSDLKAMFRLETLTAH